MENFGVKVLVETGQLLRGNFGGTYLVESPAFQNSPTVIQKWGFGCYVKNVIKIRFGWMNHFIILSKMAKRDILGICVPLGDPKRPFVMGIVMSSVSFHHVM